MKNSDYLWPEMSHLRDMIFYHDILGLFRERSCICSIFTVPFQKKSK